MAAAMARGWVGEVDSMLFTDGGSGRAGALAEEVRGKSLDSNAALAHEADLVVLAVKPARLVEVAAELGEARAIVSLLGATSLDAVQAAFPQAEAARAMPNVAVEVNRGVLCVAGELSAEARRLLGVLGHVVELPDDQFDAATAVMGCSPAYLALVVEALTDAGVTAGLERDLCRELVVETARGTTELLRRHEAVTVREAVASPGGSTEAGLEALERAGARAALEAAVVASLERMRG